MTVVPWCQRTVAGKWLLGFGSNGRQEHGVALRWVNNCHESHEIEA